MLFYLNHLRIIIVFAAISHDILQHLPCSCRRRARIEGHGLFIQVLGFGPMALLAFGISRFIEALRLESVLAGDRLTRVLI